MGSRNDVFQALKPPCVALSQAILTLNGPSTDVRNVAERLEVLQQTLQGVVQRHDALDSKLADYIFFPLSQVLKLSQRISIRCLELTLSIVAVLVDKGWRHGIEQQLAHQLLILCTLLAGREASGISSGETTPELQTNALWCLCRLFKVLKDSDTLLRSFSGDSRLPQLGQTISTILSAIYDSSAPEVQLAGANALTTFVNASWEPQLLSNFIPGLISMLTKVLTPQTTQRRHASVLILCLDSLNRLLEVVFRDRASKDTTTRDSHTIEEDIGTPDGKPSQTIESAAPHVNRALSSVVKLRNHSRDDVKESLGRMCTIILRHCSKALSDSVPLALETVVTLSASAHTASLKFEVQMLLFSSSSLSQMLQNTLYDWLQSLTRIMQSSNGEEKIRRLQQIEAAYKFLAEAGVDLTTVQTFMAHRLQDCAILTLESAGSNKDAQLTSSPIQSLDLTVANQDHELPHQFSDLVNNREQAQVLKGIESITNLTTNSRTSTTLVENWARSLQHSRDTAKIADLWLLLCTTRTMLQQSLETGAMIDLGEDVSPEFEQLEDLYSTSLSILTDYSDEMRDPRLQSLALQVLALRAQIAGEEFRYELIDALYPVLHLLATPNDQLQHDSIATLNAFARSCNYDSVRELIVENVDYLTNAVALKLNAFDVSPQAPQVLLMMVRLAGPSLLPYLEDAVESIFAALEDYHGYPLLVELLFKVLAVVADEGAKAPQLTINNSLQISALHSGVQNWQPLSVADLAGSLRERLSDELQLDADLPSGAETFPRRPWANNSENETGANTPDADENNALLHQGQRTTDDGPPPPIPKTYNLLVKITELTQHYLPSASPSLRASLLALIRTTVPAISKHENTFLPLVNTLWPEVVSRLDDPEAHVRANALEIVALLCEHAKDFMRSRLISLWPHLREVYSALADQMTSLNAPGKAPKRTPDLQNQATTPTTLPFKQLVQRMEASPADYNDTSIRLLWQAMTKALTSIVRFVPLSPEMFDEALDMAEPVIDNPGVAEAFQNDNADAVWLLHLRSGDAKVEWKPCVSLELTWQFAEVAV